MMLESTKQMLIRICAYPAHGYVTKQEQLKYHAIAYITFLALIFQLIFYFRYFYKHISVDIIGSLYAFMVSVAIASMVYISIVAFSLKYKMKAAFDDLSKIYDSSK